MSRDNSHDVFNKQRELTHQQRMKALKDYKGLDRKYDDLGNLEIYSREQQREFTNELRSNSGHHKPRRVVTFKQSPNSVKESKGAEDFHCNEISPYGQKKETTLEQTNSLNKHKGLEDTDLHFLSISLCGQKREVTYKQKPNFLQELRGLQNTDLLCPEISPNQKREATHEQRLNSLKDYKGVEYFDLRQLLDVKKSEKKRERKNVAPHVVQKEHTLASSGIKTADGKTTETTTAAQDTKTETLNAPLPCKPSLNHRMAAIRKRNDLDIEKPTNIITGTSSENTKTEMVKEDSIKVPFSSKETVNRRMAIVRETNGLGIEKPSENTKTSRENTKKEIVAEDSGKIVPTEANMTLIKNSLAALREGNRKKSEKRDPVKIANIAPSVAILLENVNNIVEHKIKHAIFKPKETSQDTKGEILTTEPIKITQTSSREMVTKQTNSLKEFKGIEDVGAQQLFENINNNFKHTVSDTIETSCLHNELIELMKKTSSQHTEKERVSSNLDVNITTRITSTDPSSQSILEDSLKDQTILFIKSTPEENNNITDVTPLTITAGNKLNVAEDITDNDGCAPEVIEEEIVSKNLDVNITNTDLVSQTILEISKELPILFIKSAPEENGNNNDETPFTITTDNKPKIIKMKAVHDDDSYSDNPFLYKEHNFLDFPNKKLNSPNPACKDVLFELLQNINCVITKVLLAYVKSRRVPQYVLEIWIKDKASSKTQLCQMAVTIRQMMAAFSLVERECANRTIFVNMLEIAVKQNAALKVVMSSTIDTEMFLEYFDNAPILNTRKYHVNTFYLDKASEVYPKTLAMCACDNHPAVIHEELVVLLQHIHERRELEGAILVFLPDWEDIVKVQNLMCPCDNVVVHLVCSELLNDEIYRKPPPGKRKMILATDIAETFITIDDLVCVVDTGMQKNNVFDMDKGINVTELKWISKANANLRAGITGSLEESYRFTFYTKERYEMFAD